MLRWGLASHAIHRPKRRTVPDVPVAGESGETSMCPNAVLADHRSDIDEIDRLAIAHSNEVEQNLLVGRLRPDLAEIEAVAADSQRGRCTTAHHRNAEQQCSRDFYPARRHLR